MSTSPPSPITPTEHRRRRDRVRRTARGVGFVGRVEYRHVSSLTGGAQYGCGVESGSDLLTVFADAFDRDADPDDFSLRAIIAHERGHQLLARHPPLAARLGGMSLAAEEVLASLIRARVLPAGEDRDALLAKAVADALGPAATGEDAVRLVSDLWDLLGELL